MARIAYIPRFIRHYRKQREWLRPREEAFRQARRLARSY
jgi:hypothetical protein